MVYITHVQCAQEALCIRNNTLHIFSLNQQVKVPYTVDNQASVRPDYQSSLYLLKTQDIVLSFLIFLFKLIQ